MPTSSDLAARVLLDEPSAAAANDVVVALLDQAHATRIATAAEDWSALRLAGITAAGAAGQALGQLAGVAAAQAAQRDHVLAVADDLTVALVEAVKNAPDLVQLIRDQAAANGISLTTRAVDLLDVLDVNPADADVRSVAANPASATRTPSPLAGGSAVASAGSRGLMAQVHAALQQAFDIWDGVGPAGLPDAGQVHGAIRGHADVLVARLSAAQHDGHSAILAGTADRAGLAGMIRAAESIALAAAPAQALAHRVADAERAAGRGGAAEALGRQSLRLARVMRESMATQAAGYALRLHLHGVHLDDSVADVLAAAPTLPVTSGLPDGPDTPIADVAGRPPGTLVEVFGVAESMSTIVEADGKVVGRLTLQDPSSRALVRADLVFTNPQHVGVTVGAFCGVTGTVVVPAGDGHPRLRADKVAVTAEAGRSWRGALLHIASPYLPYWRARTNLSWTAGPHRIVRTSSGVDEGASDMGAAELLFLPFRTS